MYEFHCNFDKKHFDVELLFIDTDSLTYEKQSKDVLDSVCVLIKHLFDFSERRV